MRLASIYVALLRSSVPFLSLFNIHMAEDEECVGGIHLELKKVDTNKRDWNLVKLINREIHIIISLIFKLVSVDIITERSQ